MSRTGFRPHQNCAVPNRSLLDHFYCDGTVELRAEALMSADHRPIVLMEGMSLRLSGTNRDHLVSTLATERDCRTCTRCSHATFTCTYTAQAGYDIRPALFTAEQVMAGAVGNPSRGSANGTASLMKAPAV